MNKIVLVTGASRGIGAATALLAASAGYDICINYLGRQAEAERVLGTITDGGGKGWIVQGDVGNEPDVLRMFASIDDREGQLVGLVNNAGILFQQTPLSGMDAERINEVMRVNVTGSLVCAREAVKRMSTEQGGIGGSIVNVSSAASRIGAPNEYIDYAASKGAIDTFTLGLAKESAHLGIRVNAVRPGMIETDIHAAGGMPDRVERLKGNIPMLRGGKAEEVAESIVWLLSEKSSYVSGALLDVSGAR